MRDIRRTVRYKRDKWTNRMAIMGITLVVVCLAIVISTKGQGLAQSDRGYQMEEEQLQAQLEEEKERAEELEEYRIYVKTKQYAEEVAKEKLGLPGNQEVLMLLDLGFPAEGAGPLPNHASRKPLEETVEYR